MARWKDYEKLTYKIYTELSPTSLVILNDSIYGHDTEEHRQIDVSVRSSIAGLDYLMIIDAKDYGTPADVNVVGKFKSVVEDVRANKGVLVCSSGFTSTARVYARKIGLDICSAYDAMSKDWRTEVEIPVVRSSSRMEYEIVAQVNAPALLMNEIVKNPKAAWKSAMLIRLNGTETTIFDEVVARWDRLEIIPENGQLDLFEPGLMLRILGSLVSLSQLIIKYNRQTEFYLKFFTPVDYRGLKDYILNKFRPSYLEFGEEQIPFFNDGTWRSIDSRSEISVNASVIEIEMFEFGFEDKPYMRMNFKP